MGTKYDMFSILSVEEQQETDQLARKYAKAMHASLIFTSSSNSINVQKLFKIVVSKLFNLGLSIEPIEGVGDPLLIF